jgi:hypothetical protein
MKSKFNIRCRTNQNFASSLVLIAAFILLCGLFHTSSAQIIRPNLPVAKPTPTPPQKLIVFKATGAGKPRSKFGQITKLSPPAPLSQTEKQNLFNQALLSNGAGGIISLELPFAVLSPRATYIDDKAALEFYTASGVSTRQGFAYFDDQKQSSFWVYIKPTKINQWFMVDCSLTVSNGSRTFKISEPTSGVVAEKTISGADHIQVFLQSQYADWDLVAFETIGPGSPWFFYSCEVTKRD